MWDLNPWPFCGLQLRALATRSWTTSQHRQPPGASIPLSQWCILRIPPFPKYHKFPYFCKSCEFPTYFRSIYVSWLNLRFAPSFYHGAFTYHALHVLQDASELRLTATGGQSLCVVAVRRSLPTLWLALIRWHCLAVAFWGLGDGCLCQRLRSQNSCSRIADWCHANHSGHPHERIHRRRRRRWWRMRRWRRRERWTGKNSEYRKMLWGERQMKKGTQKNGDIVDSN